MYDPNAVKIYTDGSAKPNPGKGGVGMVIEFPDNLELNNEGLSEGYESSTNNRMELRAVIRAHEWLSANSTTYKFTRAIIITDSEYVHNNHNSVHRWKKDGWQNKDGKPYENPDLWGLFLREQSRVKLRVEITWTKGKQDDILKHVDVLAKQGAENPTMTDSGYKPGKFTAPRTPTKKGALLFPAEGQDAIIRIYRSAVFGRYASQVYKITFDLFDENTDKYVSKHTVYTKIDFDLKRNTCYKVKFNDNKRFPQITAAKKVDYLKGG